MTIKVNQDNKIEGTIVSCNVHQAEDIFGRSEPIYSVVLLPNDPFARRLHEEAYESHSGGATRVDWDSQPQDDYLIRFDSIRPPIMGKDADWREGMQACIEYRTDYKSGHDGEVMFPNFQLRGVYLPEVDPDECLSEDYDWSNSIDI